MPREMKVAAEAAEAEFDKWAETWGLDTDVASMSDEDRDSFGGLKRRLCRAIEFGDLTVSDDHGSLTYKLLYPHSEELAQLKFDVPKGNAYVSWDKYKERESMHKLNSYLGNMTGQSPRVFGLLDGRDLKICQGIAQLFLGS